ncbi:MAG: M48 family metallopeptidase [bacterium]
MDFFEEQRKNRRTTLILIVIFLFVVLLIGYFIDHFYLGFDITKGPFPFATALALVISSVWAMTSYYNGDSIVLASTGAVPIDPTNEDEKLKTLMNVVQEMSIASGNPMPFVYVIPSEQPNAFATGRDPEHASIAVTKGLLDIMDRSELQAVVAHEMGHIKSHDIQTMTFVAVLLGAIVLMSDWLWRISFYTPRRRDKNADLKGTFLILLIAVALAIVAPLIGQIIAMTVSREREYAADEASVEFTRNPLALASALEKIKTGSVPMKNASRGTAHMFIVDPLEKTMGNKEGFLANLLATHPPINKRISRLKLMGHEVIAQGYGRRN